MRLKCGKDSEDEESCDCLERLLHEQEEKIYRMENALEELRGDRESMQDEIETKDKTIAQLRKEIADCVAELARAEEYVERLLCDLHGEPYDQANA
jgi:bacterioferritin (cytochrome b1)